MQETARIYNEILQEVVFYSADLLIFEINIFIQFPNESKIITDKSEDFLSSDLETGENDSDIEDKLD